MPHYLLLFENETLRTCVGKWLLAKVAGGKSAVVPFPESAGNRQTEVVPLFEDVGDWISAEFAKLAQQTEYGKLVVITDYNGRRDFQFSHLDPMGDHGPATVLGMLVLAYPDAGWLFVGNPPSDAHSGSARLSAHFCGGPSSFAKLVDSYSLRLTTLFDGFGLRDDVRRLVGKAGETRVQLPSRRRLAVAVDEEHNYAYMHAYIAYRFGFIAHAVVDFGGMAGVLRKGDPIELLFEDLFLEFPDLNGVELSDLEARDKEFPALATAKSRLLVTSGDVNDQQKDKNSRHLLVLEGNGQWNNEMAKPLGGIFDVWVSSELSLQYPGHIEVVKRPETEADGTRGHGAPGRLIVIADRLISRARAIPRDSGLPELLKRAVFAGDAIDLLAGKTPTTALQALMLKHESEVLAECQFLGMQHHVALGERINEIHKQVELHTRWFGPDKRSLAARNAELSILSRLVEVFQSHNRFDEDQALQAKIRPLHRQLRVQTYPKPFQALGGMLLCYFDTLISSFPKFLLFMAGWIVFFAIGFRWFAGAPSLSQAFVDSFSTFLSIQAPTDNPVWQWDGRGWNGHFWVIAFAIVIGFLHLGIFISYVYSRISRR